MGRPVFIGIDPGTKCGWAALAHDGARLASGVWDLKSRRHEGGGMRYVRARRHIRELLDTFDVEAVGYEEVRRHAGTSAAHVYGGIVAVITAECEERSIPYSGEHWAQVKKHATGRGNSGKLLMEDAANRRWAPHVVADDNEADALWAADLLRESLR
jgi:crossover junction endodeoxyribonuclease RuvC